MDLTMRLVDLLIMQSDNLWFLPQFIQQFNLIDVGGLYGRVDVPHVHLLQCIYLIVLSQDLEDLPMGVQVGMLYIVHALVL